ncbi:MAG TPA: MFS transporter [Actinomycetes bacterium]|nr:MFS transporter [Actinomycetes bacterium]
MSRSGRAPLREVWRNREVRGLLLAQVCSDAGDQVARIALTLLVYERSGSLLAAAATLAVSFIPGVVAKAMLGSLADRYPRRTVMVVCDLLRALVIGFLALLAGPGTSIAPLLALLLVSELATGPFASARTALYADILRDPSEFTAAQAAGRMVNLGMQVGGFVVGGIVIQLIGAREVLALDALTFLVSYALVRTQVRARPAADETGTSVRRLLADVKLGAREIFRDPLKRPIVLVSWISTLYFSAPEAVAVGYHPGQSATTSGLLLAAAPAGSFVGAAVLSRVRLPDQVPLIVPMACLSCLTLFATSIDPEPAVAFGLWFVAGSMTAFVITIIASVVQLTLPARRGRVVGMAFAGFNAASAVAYLVMGWAAESLGAARAVSLAGVVGLASMLIFRLVWRQDRLVNRLDALSAPAVISLPEDERSSSQVGPIPDPEPADAS